MGGVRGPPRLSLPGLGFGFRQGWILARELRGQLALLFGSSAYRRTLACSSSARVPLAPARPPLVAIARLLVSEQQKRPRVPLASGSPPMVLPNGYRPFSFISFRLLGMR